MGYARINPETIQIDALAERCGLFTSDTDRNNGYGCRSKSKDKAEPGCCLAWDCPLAFLIDEEDPEWDDAFTPGDWVVQTHEKV